MSAAGSRRGHQRGSEGDGPGDAASIRCWDAYSSASCRYRDEFQSILINLTRSFNQPRSLRDFRSSVQPIRPASRSTPSSQSPLKKTSCTFFSNRKPRWQQFVPTFIRLIRSRGTSFLTLPIRLAKGCTSREVPITIRRSHFAKSSSASLKNRLGRFSPKNT